MALFNNMVVMSKCEHGYKQFVIVPALQYALDNY